jgi:hypothetical protein
MKWAAAIAVAVLLALFAAAPGMAQPAGSGAEPEVLVQQSPKRRPRARIEVRPRAYPHRHYHSVYPVPYDIEYPGPNAHRECVGGYAVERRPSGTVVTPRLRCRWVPGRYAGP